MELTTNELPWSPDDRNAWKTFLATKAGLRLIPRALEHAPSLLGEGESNKILIRSGELRGFQYAFQAMLSLAEPPPKEQPPEPSAYPPLDSDEQWADGNTLTGNK